MAGPPSARAREITIVANDVGPVGGMERQLLELVNGCLADDRAVTVIARTCTGAEHPRLRVHRLRGPARPLPAAYPWFGLAAAAALRRHGRGIVHTCGAIVPGRVDVIAMHFCHRAYNDVPGRSRASREAALYRLNASVASRMSEWGEQWCLTPDRVRAVVAVSAGVRRELHEHYPALGNRLWTIPHGVDGDRFRPDAHARVAVRRRWGVGDVVPVALFVGGDWRRKGLEHAIRAVGSAPPWRLVVVGHGDREAFATIASDAGAGGRVSFTGPTDDPAAAFAGADAFVLPTAYETFSLVTYEAASSGLPLLVTRVSGPDELVTEGVNGWFLDREPQHTAQHLQRLAADPDLRRRMGEAARQAAQPYTWEAAVAAHLELYDGLAAGT